MKTFTFNLPHTTAPFYQRLAECIRTHIQEGRLKPGEILPSTREMARIFKVHRHTIMNALRELEAEGWVTSREKKYYQVTSTLPSTFLQAKKEFQSSSPVKERAWRFARQSDVRSYSSLSGYRHSFPSGFPDLRFFPMREFKSHLYDAINSKGVLSYGDPRGDERLISEIATYLRRVRNIEGREIVVTNGSQEAIFLLAQLLIKPGDSVAVEALGYPPAFEALKFAGARLIPIQIDSEGLVVEDLKRQLKTKKIKFLYVTPLHQFPTTVTLSASRRLQLYELAYKHGILILEDDYDHEFHFVSQPVAPLASFDPGNVVLYISTFSKILFPSARIGFLAIPRKVAEQMGKLKQISSRQNEQILQITIAKWMASGGFERHLRKMRRVYEVRRNGMLESLSDLKQKHGSISWIPPDGGMALWLNVSRDSTRIAEQARKSGILVHPEGNYRLDGKSGTHLRLGFAGQTARENREGLESLFVTL